MIRKLLIILMVLNFCKSFSQYTVSRNGVIYDQNDNHVKVADFKNILYKHPKLLSVYESGRNKKDFGNTFMIGGFSLAAIGLADAMLGPATTGESQSIALPLIGGGMFIIGGLIKI